MNNELENIKEKITGFDKKDLEELKISINSILESKKEKNIIYRHDCFENERSNYHFNKYVHSSKKLIGIDDTKTNRLAFLGDWLKNWKEDIVAEGDFVIEACDNNLRLYKIKNDGKELLAKGTDDYIITFIKKVKEITKL